MSALEKFLVNYEKVNLTMKELFSKNSNRFKEFSRLLSFSEGEILVDFSKNLIDNKTFDQLIGLVVYFLNVCNFLG